MIAREIETYTFPFEVTPEPYAALSFTGYSITESKYSEDEELLTIEIGINTDYSLEKIDSDLLQVSEELPGQFCPKKNRDCLRIAAIDFNNSDYQSYSNGEYDSGSFAYSEDFSEYVNKIKAEINSRTNSAIKNWLNS